MPPHLYGTFVWTFNWMMRMRVATQSRDQPITKLSIAAIRRDLGISQERLARVLDVSAKTVHRWEDQDQLPTNRWILQVVRSLQEITELGLRVFTPDGLHALMTQPQPGLDNQSGLALVEAGRSEEVVSLIAAAYEGFLGE